MPQTIAAPSREDGTFAQAAEIFDFEDLSRILELIAIETTPLGKLPSYPAWKQLATAGALVLEGTQVGTIRLIAAIWSGTRCSFWREQTIPTSGWVPVGVYPREAQESAAVLLAEHLL